MSFDAKPGGFPVLTFFKEKSRVQVFDVEGDRVAVAKVPELLDQNLL